MGTARERSVSARKMAVCFLIFLLTASLILDSETLVFASSKGVVNYALGLNIRSGPGTDETIVASIPYNQSVTITGEESDINGDKWYLITSTYGDGYVYAEYITVNQTGSTSSSTSTSTPSDMTDFEAYLTSQGFPESYKPYLRDLHADYPDWRFTAMHTGLDWEDVIYRETHPVSISLVPNSWSDAWKSTERAAFDAESGDYIIFDSGGYVAASEAAVAYYMDPRNNLDDETIFQFLSNKFDGETQTVSGVASIAKGSYLEAKNPGDGYGSYAELIYDIGGVCRVNPMTIASMLIVEQGKSGDSDLISGTAAGYEGYYNFFNVGAYAASGRNAVENGLIYAAKHEWNSPYESILGGARIYADNYVYNNKSTIYFQKFNVLNGLSSVGTGQYMTAIYAASSEGRVLAEGYTDFMNGGITFEIPIYENMPAYASPHPGTGDNIAYLESLSVDGYDLSPTFNTYTTSYTIRVNDDVESVSISAKPVSSYSRIDGTGTVKLNSGDESINIVCTSSSGNSKIYNIKVIRDNQDINNENNGNGNSNSNSNNNNNNSNSNSNNNNNNNNSNNGNNNNPNSENPASEPKLTSSAYKLGDVITRVSAGTSGSKFTSSFSVTDGSIKVYNASGEELINDTVGTGSILKLYDMDGNEKSTYTVIVKGDNNGDGKVNSADALRVQRHSVGTLTLSGVQLTASDVNGDGKYNSADALLMQRYSVGTYNISW